ncbi:MAG: Copper binding protein plastocyanin/azurin family [Gemmatimonadetes bacterium]|nr:Copper binding protein plastocyanin/azurin family [Gemmatimonadota bacterium]
MRVRLVLPLVAIAIAACGGSSTGPNPPAHTATINVTDTGFSPESLDVQLNTLVTWSVTGGSMHHVVRFTGNVPSGGNPNSSDLTAGHSASTTFLQAGTYHYDDSLHTGVSGFTGLVYAHP